jgi:UPF0755 protein
MNKRNLIIFLVIAPLFAVALAGAKIYYSISIWKYNGSDVHFSVRPGEGFSKINYRLNKKGLISSAKLFHRYAQVNGLMKKFKTGDYVIKSESTMLDIFNLLIEGKGITIKVTIPEGKNMFEIGKILEVKGVTTYKKFITKAKDPDFTTSLGIPASRVEGYLYPETYNFSKNSKPEQVIKAMVNVFKSKTSKIDFSGTDLSKHSVVTLASVVEKETGASFERPMIAGVFHNRLQKRMRLQSDPTTIYGIYENFNGNLRKKHLLEKTPYNTYKIPALPKGPISNPGIEAIKATLNPRKHQFIYFVSKNDGTHIFSRNYKDHRNAVNEYQKNRKNRAGKSWRDLKQKK